MFKLRPYQEKAEREILNAWTFVPNVLFVLPTGGGKTVTMSRIAHDIKLPTLLIAHRQELVSQISLALSRYGVKHRLIAPKNTIRTIVSIHLAELGRSLYDPSAMVSVAGVDTVMSRADELKSYLYQVRLIIQDEAHHVLRENKWGKVTDLVPNAKLLGVTANTVRADGKGLGRHADGYFDLIVEGPGMRDLIEDGYLTPYRIFAPPSDYVRPGAEAVGSTGDFKLTVARESVRKSHVVGDVVDHYKRLAFGKLGVTFTTDVETASDISAKFREAGIPSEVVSAKTPDKIRVDVLRRFRNREVMQLVNVDLFGEGFDVPAIEVVSMARPTESFNLFCQQFGRALRPFYVEGGDLETRAGRLSAIRDSIKPHAILIDHVGNCIRFAQTHGLPDSRITWSLDGREKRSRAAVDPGLIPVTACPSCSQLYEKIYRACPHCGFVRQPVARSAPEFVDGDLHELDEATLAALRGEVERIDLPPSAIRTKMERAGAPSIAAAGAAKLHKQRQEAQRELREAIALWAGYQRAAGRPDSESYRRFFFTFGTDVLTAQTLGRPDAETLAAKVRRACTAQP